MCTSSVISTEEWWMEQREGVRPPGFGGGGGPGRLLHRSHDPVSGSLQAWKYLWARQSSVRPGDGGRCEEEKRGEWE